MHHGSRSITGVEISLGTLRAITGPYAEFAGFPADPRVELIHGDRRSFAKSTDLRFDIIQPSGVDTITVRSSGSMVLAEDYPYTVDAFQDFLGILKPGVVLSVVRFGEETMSLAAIAVVALRDMCVESPVKHIVALRQKKLCGVLYALPYWARYAAACAALSPVGSSWAGSSRWDCRWQDRAREASSPGPSP